MREIIVAYSHIQLKTVRMKLNMTVPFYDKIISSYAAYRGCIYRSKKGKKIESYCNTIVTTLSHRSY